MRLGRHRHLRMGVEHQAQERRARAPHAHHERRGLAGFGAAAQAARAKVPGDERIRPACEERLALARGGQDPQVLVEGMAVDDAFEHCLPLRGDVAAVAKLAPRVLRLVGAVDLGPGPAAGEDLLEDARVTLDLPQAIAADRRRPLPSAPRRTAGHAIRARGGRSSPGGAGPTAGPPARARRMRR